MIPNFHDILYDSKTVVTTITPDHLLLTIATTPAETVVLR